ncbi:glycosyltransferase family 2 protein [Xylanibacter brevis]|uniref:glycosyltransferase family 2 protein n=1 Tax=Xylanibacter brevis TaxID=83231 RepID=UPI000693F6B8|nr:glycosyltransferase family 2 protein [Xylanibacter brevis]
MMMKTTAPDITECSPLVTIGIPVYNVEPYIEKCLLSVLNQTYQNLEILVVDDLGTDNSMQIVAALQKSHPRGDLIRIVAHDMNKGIGEARNTAIRECKGKYLYFIDSDDFIESNAIQLLVEQAEKYNTDVAIASHRRVALDTGEELPTYQYAKYQLFQGKDAFANYVCQDLRWHVAIVVWNILFSAVFLRKNDLQFYGRKEEDALFLSDYYSEVNTAVIIPDITYNYVSRPNSIMGYMARKQIPIREIRERFQTDSIMTSHCARLKDRSFYDVHCARVMKHKFRAVCVALRHRHRFTEKIFNEEIRQELKHPASISEIIRFKRYRGFHFFFYLLSKLPSSLFVCFSYILGRTMKWI